jgi:hypothetical protein
VLLACQFLGTLFSLKSKTGSGYVTEENTAKVNVIDEDIVKPGKQGLPFQISTSWKGRMMVRNMKPIRSWEYVDLVNR